MAWRTVLTLMLAPAAVFATSSGGPTKRTGAAVDGGLTCLQCHNQFAPPVNQGAGRILVSVNAYTPGSTYSLNVQITDPSSIRWGFQLTARLDAAQASVGPRSRHQSANEKGKAGGACFKTNHRRSK